MLGSLAQVIQGDALVEHRVVDLALAGALLLGLQHLDLVLLHFALAHSQIQRVGHLQVAHIGGVAIAVDRAVLGVPEVDLPVTGRAVP